MHTVLSMPSSVTPVRRNNKISLSSLLINSYLNPLMLEWSICDPWESWVLREGPLPLMQHVNGTSRRWWQRLHQAEVTLGIGLDLSPWGSRGVVVLSSFATTSRALASLSSFGNLASYGSWQCEDLGM